MKLIRDFLVFFFKDIFPPSNILLFFSLSTKFFSCFENITCYLDGFFFFVFVKFSFYRRILFLNQIKLINMK